MIVSPMDNPYTGPLGADAGMLALAVCQDWMKAGTDIKELVEEVSQVLAAVDLATSSPCDHLGRDRDFHQMRVSWAFLGPGLHKQIEALKMEISRPRLVGHNTTEYALLANIHTFLFIRRQTLELNGIDVLKMPAA
jgi:hypothetical protein